MRPIARRPLGRADLVVSELGFGCWQLGGRGWGRVSGREVVSAIELAARRGVNLFDTAPVYGLGRSEELLGKTLDSLGEDVVIVSKGGLVWDASGRVEHDGRPESLRRQLLASLKRLRRDRLDGYVLHWPDPDVPVEESLSSLEALRMEGLIRSWGVSNLALPVVQATLERERGPAFIEQPVNALEAYPEEHWSVAEEGASILSAAGRHGIGVLAFDVLARGLLARAGAGTLPGRRDVRRRDWRFSRAGAATLLDARERLMDCARRQEKPPSAFAIRAALERPGVTSCLVGMKSRRQLEENLRYAEVELPEELSS